MRHKAVPACRAPARAQMCWPVQRIEKSHAIVLRVTSSRDHDNHRHRHRPGCDGVFPRRLRRLSQLFVRRGIHHRIQPSRERSLRRQGREGGRSGARERARMRDGAARQHERNEPRNSALDSRKLGHTEGRRHRRTPRRPCGAREPAREGAGPGHQVADVRGRQPRRRRHSRVRQSVRRRGHGRLPRTVDRREAP